MNTYSRRSILRALAVAPSAAVAVASSIPTSRTPTPSGETLRYGLFFDEADIPRLRTTYNSALFEDLRTRLVDIDYEAEAAFLENEIRYNDQLFTIARLAANIEQQSFVFLMTGDPTAHALARASIEALMKFDRWDFFLDGDKSIGVQRAPYATLAVSLACDWLGDSISDTDRRRWIETMGERGVQACYNSSYAIMNPRSVTEWRFDPESTYFEHRPGNRTDQNRRAEITQQTNLRAVPASALVIGAIAHRIELGDTAETSNWLNLGIQSVEAFRDIFQPDGSYEEEVQYSIYTASHLLQAAIVTERHGIKNIYDIVNWDGFAEFLLNMSMPSADDPYEVVNFGDSGNKSFNSRTRTALPFWIASHNNNSRAQWLALHRAGNHNLWSAVWYNSEIPTMAPDSKPAFWLSDLDRIVVRSGWSNSDTVVGFRSGSPANHEHADRNSIMVSAHGEKLITDPLRPPYSFADPAWKMRLTQGHSAILIDGRGHEHHNGVEGTNASNSYARIKEHGTSEHFAWWRSVATQPYRLVDIDIRNVVRSVAVLYRSNVIVIADFIDKYDEASTVTARFFGNNADGAYQAKVSSEGFAIRRPAASLTTTIASNVPFDVRRGKAFVPQEVADIHPFVDVETGAAKDVLLVSVLAIAEDGSLPAEALISETDTGFDVTVDSQLVRVTRQSIAVIE